MSPKDREDFVQRLNEELKKENESKTNLWQGVYNSLSSLIGRGGGK